MPEPGAGIKILPPFEPTVVRERVYNHLKIGDGRKELAAFRAATGPSFGFDIVSETTEQYRMVVTLKAFETENTVVDGKNLGPRFSRPGRLTCSTLEEVGKLRSSRHMTESARAFGAVLKGERHRGQALDPRSISSRHKVLVASQNSPVLKSQ